MVQVVLQLGCLAAPSCKLRAASERRPCKTADFRLWFANQAGRPTRIWLAHRKRPAAGGSGKPPRQTRMAACAGFAALEPDEADCSSSSSYSCWLVAQHEQLAQQSAAKRSKPSQTRVTFRKKPCELLRFRLARLESHAGRRDCATRGAEPASWQPTRTGYQARRQLHAQNGRAAMKHCDNKLVNQTSGWPNWLRPIQRHVSATPLLPTCCLQSR